MLTGKGCVPGVVPRKQLADMSDDDAKTWKEEQIMKRKKNNQEKELDYGTACVSLLLHVSLTKGNNQYKKKHLRAEMKCGSRGQNAQFISSFTVSK